MSTLEWKSELVIEAKKVAQDGIKEQVEWKRTEHRLDFSWCLLHFVRLVPGAEHKNYSRDLR